MLNPSGQTIGICPDPKQNGLWSVGPQEEFVAVSLIFPGLVQLRSIVKHNDVPTPHPGQEHSV